MFIKTIKTKTFFITIGILLLYVLSFFILTRPLIFNFTSAIAGVYTSDAPIFLWDAWETQKNIASGDYLKFETQDIFFPHTTPLLMHTYNTVNSFVVVGLNFILKNIVLSFNIVYLASAVLCAWFSYLFFKLITKNTLASVLAGHFFAFQHIWAIYAIFGTQNILSFWFIPGALYFYEVYRQTTKTRNLFFSGTILGLAFINDFIIFSFTAFVLALYILFSQIYFEKEKRLLNAIKNCAIILLSFFVVAGWKIFIIIKQSAHIAEIAIPSLGDVEVYFADPINLFRPSKFHMLWGHLNWLYKDTSIANGNAFLGFTFFAVILIFILVLITKKIKFENKKIVFIFLGMFFITLSMSFGPHLHFWGFNTQLPMPHIFISKLWEQINNLRVTMRWLIPATFFSAGVFGFLLKYIFDNISKTKSIILFSFIYAGLVLDVLFFPKQMSYVNKNLSPIFNIIAQDKSPGSVLEMPLSVTSGYFTLGEPARISLLHQTVHQKPIIGGHLSRLPQETKLEYEKEPIIKYLLLYKQNNPDKTDLDKNNIELFFKKYQTKYLVWDKTLAQTEDKQSKKVLDYITNQLNFVSFYNDQYIEAFIKN